MRDETRQVEDETVKWAMSDVAPMSDEAFDRGRTALLARIDAGETAEATGNVVPLAPRRRDHDLRTRRPGPHHRGCRGAGAARTPARVTDRRGVRSELT